MHKGWVREVPFSLFLTLISPVILMEMATSFQKLNAYSFPAWDQATYIARNLRSLKGNFEKEGILSF